MSLARSTISLSPPRNHVGQIVLDQLNKFIGQPRSAPVGDTPSSPRGDTIADCLRDALAIDNFAPFRLVRMP